MSGRTQLTFGFATPSAVCPSDAVRQAVEGAPELRGHLLSAKERELVARLSLLEAETPCPTAKARSLEDYGHLEELLLNARSIEERRVLGQFLTPHPIVDLMVRWVQQQGPEQVVDAGCGTGRFAIAAARAMPETRMLAVDADPVAALLCRAQVTRLGLDNIEVRCADFLHDDIPLGGGRTAFVGNPPYVRHHRLSADEKTWGAQVAKELGIPFSKLAGLHVYFFLATALRARPGDVGCYLTSSEWLDVRYGEGLRRLLTSQLGLKSLCLLAESSAAFEDAMTSAVITCFHVGRRNRNVRVSVVREFRRAEGPKSAKSVSVDELDGRWSRALRDTEPENRASDRVRLGDLVSVHRGIATGANGFFVMELDEARELGLDAFAKPVITSGKQVLDSGGVVHAAGCKALILLPERIDTLPRDRHDAARRYLARGEREGVPGRYLCQHRRPWWWLGAPEPPPAVASYMARRPPRFALNPDGVLILNIAHGLFPRCAMSRSELAAFVDTLNAAAQSFVGNGRRYQGGLEKFEPREMEDLLIPPFRRGREGHKAQ